MERTEEQILVQSGAKVRLGEKEYEVKPLTMRKALKWRQNLSPLLASMLSKDGALASRDTLRQAITDSPQQMTDAVFAYLELPDEERERILDTATEDEMLGAFFIVMGFAFRPITGQRALAAWMVDPTLIEKAQQSPPPSKLQ